MAKTQRPSRDQVERDEVADSFQQTVEAIYANRNTLMLGALAVILLAIAIRAYVVYSDNRQIQLNETLSTTLTQYEQLSRTTDAKARAQQANSLVGQLNGVIPNYGTGSRLARALIFLKGSVLYSIDQYKPAQEAYTQYLQAAGDNEERARGEIALGYAYENQAFSTTSTLTQRSLVDQALDHYKKAQQAANGEHQYLYYYAKLGEARANELVGENKKAIELYSDIVKNRPAPKPASTPAAEEGQDSQQKRMNDVLRQMLADAEDQLSFAATAKLRLERLQARANLAPASSTTVTTATTPVAK